MQTLWMKKMWLEDENSTKGFQLGSSTDISHRQSAKSVDVSYQIFRNNNMLTPKNIHVCLEA